MRCKHALLFSLIAAPLCFARAVHAGPFTKNEQPSPVVNAPGYYYFMTKSGTRALIQRNRIAARAEALRRERARTATNAAPAQEFVPAPPGSSSVSAAPAPAIAPNRPAGFVPKYPVATNQTRVAIVPAPPRTNTTALQPAPRPNRERTPPIVETSGPEYNDRDPLLGYQLDQAAKGNPESEYAVAIRYLTGNGVPRDPQLGREWLEKSSAHGNLRACAKLRELQHGKNS